MKFTDGFWHNRPGVDAQYAAEAYDVTAVPSPDGDALVVHAPTRVIGGRGDTLNRALLTVTLTSPLEGVVRVRVEHHRGALPRPGFELVGAEKGHGRARVDDVAGLLATGPLHALIRRGAPWGLSFTDGDQVLTTSGHKSVGYVRLAPGAPVPAEPTGITGVTTTGLAPAATYV